MASKKQLKRLESKYLSLAFDECLFDGNPDYYLRHSSFFDRLGYHIFKHKKKLNKANEKFIDRHVANEYRKYPFNLEPF